MHIAEIFYSIQGEGTLTGVPSVFIRTSGCNLRCRWCDTKYASWNPEGADMQIAEIMEQVAAWEQARHVVITGGEPMVAKGIRELCMAIKEQGLHITIETACTIAPGGIKCDLASLSPKLRNSTPESGEIDPGWIDRHEKLRFQPDIICEWLENYDSQLKFVVSAPADVAEIAEWLAPLRVPIRRDRILLMPEGTHSDALKSRQQELIALCKDHGFRYCDRLQIHIFGNARGT